MFSIKSLITLAILGSSLVASHPHAVQDELETRQTGV